ncbi:MAG: polysaccharide deacetylase family protein [Acidobacteria bacterium]|nr:polysaccharide deacetylase family protein [Acidobacteriota bacterium]
MLKKMKQALLGGLKTLGVFNLVQNSKWRQERLLIIAYHGTSLDDEHLWNPELFMHPDYLRSRMRTIKELGYTILPLNESIQRLYANDLPARSLALTFDDGLYDFYKQAYPILDEFKFPVTLYLTTYYSHFNRPVFDAVCPYLIWKRRDLILDLKELTGQSVKLDLSKADARDKANVEILGFARREKLSGIEKDLLAAKLAKQLKVDYEYLLANRILHLLKPDEVRELAASGADIQLHTHRHRTPMDRQMFYQEIEDNRSSIREMTGYSGSHFCYPSGIHTPAFLPWLKEMGVISATTCDPGLASQNSDSLLLPRFVDTSLQSPIEFEGWLTGVAASLPRRSPPPPDPKLIWEFAS